MESGQKINGGDIFRLSLADFIKFFINCKLQLAVKRLVANSVWQKKDWQNRKNR